MNKELEDKFPHYWLCYVCADKKGGVWSKGHVATAHLGECPYCKKKETTLVPWVDFNWMGNKEATAFAERNRD